jgi:hypothetical protein
VEVGAFIAAVVFAVRTRGRPGGRLATAGAEVSVTRRAPEPALPKERHGGKR